MPLLRATQFGGSFNPTPPDGARSDNAATVECSQNGTTDASMIGCTFLTKSIGAVFQPDNVINEARSSIHEFHESDQIFKII